MPLHPLWIRTKTGLAFDDVPVRPGGRMPDFCVIGAAKAGTTSLDSYLGQHPDIFMCPLKEPHYFSANAIFEKGARWYRGLYADARAHQKCGEASTSYTRYPVVPDAPRRIYKTNPEMRLIYIAREPVARVQSECLQAMKYARHVAGDKNMPDTVDAVLDYLSGEGRHLATLPVETSEYMLQIDRYLEVFPRERLLVILMEDLKEKPHEALAQIFRHIGADPAFRPDLNAQLNRTDDFIEGVKIDQALGAVKRVPGAAALKSWLPAALRNQLKSMMAKAQPAKGLRLSPQRKAALKAHFKPHNAHLADFLGRDLSHWDA